MAIPFDSARRLADAVRRGETTAVAATEAALAAIDARDRDLGAFLAVGRESAPAAAAAIDAARAAGNDPGPLAGVPVAIKDNLLTADLATTCGSRILEGFRPLHDATAVARLRAAGAVVVGKTNLDEFGMGSSTENSAFGPTRNPWDATRVPGGSSGGSAAAVAAGLVPLALGSDTGGSVRQPAAFCGVYGLKPTWGRVSRFGLVAYASSLDQIGCFARTPEDLEALYATVAGHDPRDATAATAPVESPRAEGIAGLRIGVASDLFDRAGVDRDVAARTREAAKVLETGGGTLVETAFGDPDEAIAAYYLIATAEASSNLARYDGVRYGLREGDATLFGMQSRTRGRGFGAEVKRRILLGTFALSAGYVDAYYLRAQETRRRLRARFLARFAEVDLILLPTSPTTAFPLGERVRDPLAMMLADVFTVSANLAGLPAVSLPAGLDGAGLPIGVQLLAPPWRESWLLAAARVTGATWPVGDPEGRR